MATTYGKKHKWTRPSVGMQITSGQAGQVPIQLKAASSQTGDLLNFLNSSGTETLEVTSGAVIRGSATFDLALQTASDNKRVRINHRDYTQTSGDSIGFSTAPAQAATTTGTVFGMQITPRVNDTFGAGTVIGGHVDCFLKGTGAGTVTGDVRALNLELVTDDNGGKTYSGNLNFIRMRAAFSGTKNGVFIPIRIEKAETQTGSVQYDAVLDLPSINAGIWHDDPTTEPSTASGYIKVRVNGNARYIQLFSTAPTD